MTNTSRKPWVESGGSFPTLPDLPTEKWKDFTPGTRGSAVVKTLASAPSKDTLVSCFKVFFFSGFSNVLSQKTTLLNSYSIWKEKTDRFSVLLTIRLHFEISHFWFGALHCFFSTPDSSVFPWFQIVGKTLAKKKNKRGWTGT